MLKQFLINLAAMAFTMAAVAGVCSFCVWCLSSGHSIFAYLVYGAILVGIAVVTAYPTAKQKHILTLRSDDMHNFTNEMCVCTSSDDGSK